MYSVFSFYQHWEAKKGAGLHLDWVDGCDQQLRQRVAVSDMVKSRQLDVPESTVGFEILT